MSDVHYSKNKVKWTVRYPTKDELECTLNWFEETGITINKYCPLDEGNYWIVTGYKEIENIETNLYKTPSSASISTSKHPSGIIFNY